jgi:hypothetical protein
MTRFTKRILYAGAVLFSMAPMLLGAAACEDEDDSNDLGEEVEDVGNELEDVADSAQETAEDVGDDVEEEVDGDDPTETPGG